MPIRASSRNRLDGTGPGARRPVTRSKSDYGGAATVISTVPSTGAYPTLRHHNIDYIDDCRGGGGALRGGSEMEDCCTSSDGDTTLPSTMTASGMNSTMNTSGGSSDYYGDYSVHHHQKAPRLNATALGCPEERYRNQQHRYRTRSSSNRPLFDGETSMGYGMDYESRSFYDARTAPKTPSRSSRVREVLLDLLLLGGRSRRRERKEKKRASSVAPGAFDVQQQCGGGATPRATSLNAPHYHQQQQQQQAHHLTPLADANERRREVTWLDERRRRRRRSSLERYLRTPSVDTALSPPYAGRDTVGGRMLPYAQLPYRHHHQQRPSASDYEMDKRWRSGEDVRRYGGRQQLQQHPYYHREMTENEEGPRRKKAREVVRIWETPRPQCVRIASMMEDGGRREKRRMGRKDAFVNSHEWTLSRQVSELHLGIIGQPHSGKTALVHRYLTQVYQAEESPEGGRFKKEVVLEGHSHLLLIRDEGNALPDGQFTLWADAILFVFAVDSWETYQGLPHLYNRMCDFRSLQEMPVILVGTTDTVSEASPRVVTEEQGKRMANKFGRCAYYETNASHGLNVEKVFKEACLKMFSSRRLSLGGYRTPTPTEKYATDSRAYAGGGSSSARGVSSVYPPASLGLGVAPSHHRSVSAVPGGDQRTQGTKPGHPYATVNAVGRAHSSAIPFSHTGPSTAFASRAASQMDPRGISPSSSQKSINSVSNGGALYSRSTAAIYDRGDMNGVYNPAALSSVSSMGAGMESSVSTSHLPTPSSTPTTQRKNRRISNIFQRPSKGASEQQHHHHNAHDGPTRDVGQGRAIPIMQGQLYKRSGGKSALNRGEWKKKFVTLTNDGKLTYHQSLKEYMDNGHGKEVFLGLAAVRLPGRQRMRNSQAASALLEGAETGGEGLQRTPRESTGAGGMQGPVASGEGTSGGGSDDGANGAPPSSTTTSRTSIPMTPQTVANSKKRRGYSRKIGGGKGNEEDEECFEIVTCDAKRWEFCAASAEEREEWVKAIEGQIDAALQKQTSAPPSSQTRVLGARTEVTAILSVPGNEACADCAATRPEWASLNLGTAICMECSGVHRNLGSHISKVRSLKFDEWPVEYLSVMRARGNAAANALWEARLPAEERPRADAPPDEREAFIRAKYVDKRYLAALGDEQTTIREQLIGAVLSGDVPLVCALLTRATAADVNASVSATDRRTVLHLACSSGRVVVVQLLLWNNADVRALDGEGRSALWHARNGDAAECAAVLLAAGLPADYGIVPADPKEAQQLQHRTTMQQQQPQLQALHESQVILGSMSSRDYSDSTRRLTSVGNA